MFKDQVTVSGRLYNCPEDAARAFGVSLSEVKERLEAGWEIQHAYTYHKPYGEITFKGETFRSIRALALKYNRDPWNVRKRLKKGYTIEDALRLPKQPPKKPAVTKPEPKIQLEKEVFNSRLDLLLGRPIEACIVKPMMFQIQTPEGQVLGEVSTVTKTNDQITARLTVDGKVVTPEILRTLADNLEFYAS